MSPDDILAMDQADPLASKRDEFELPEGTIYLDGNSLGPLSRQSRQRVQQVVEQQWANDLVQSWNTHSWIDLPIIAGERIAPLVGAAPGQIVCCDSVSVNLFKVLACALGMQATRSKVVSLQTNFPTDLYMVEGLQSLLGEENCNLVLTTTDKLAECLDESVAVLLLTQVDFRNGELLDMQELTAQAHQHGITVIWDLAHSAGAMQISLDDCEVDFAVGCGYKYLNGGPGAPAFVYANSRHQEQLQQPLCGWMGHRAPFDFQPQYAASKGIRRFLSGTPNILSLSSLDAALDVFEDVSMSQIRAKSIALSELFLSLLKQSPSAKTMRCVSPLDPQLRGSQLSFEHQHAYGLCQSLIAKGIIGDFREPNIIRFGFAPLYLRFADIYQSVDVIRQVLEQETYLDARYAARNPVT